MPVAEGETLLSGIRAAASLQHRLKLVAAVRTCRPRGDIIQGWNPGRADYFSAVHTKGSHIFAIDQATVFHIFSTIRTAAANLLVGAAQPASDSRYILVLVLCTGIRTSKPALAARKTIQACWNARRARCECARGAGARGPAGADAEGGGGAARPKYPGPLTETSSRSPMQANGLLEDGITGRARGLEGAPEMRSRRRRRLRPSLPPRHPTFPVLRRFIGSRRFASGC